jgi:predicted enzyme related to lactoylglutathione lyase
MSQTPFRLKATVLGTPDPHALAVFYSKLLGWSIATDEPDWVTLRPADGTAGLAFQPEPDFVPPLWPWLPGEQQMNSHLDISVDDLETAVQWAIENGASQAAWQPVEEVRVMLDPDGHLFCLFAHTG